MPRRAGCSRSISRNPVTLPMLHLCCCRHQRRRIYWRSVNRIHAFNPQDAFVFVWEYLDESRLCSRPVFEDPCGTRASGKVAMPFEEPSNLGNILIRHKRLQVHARFIASPRRKVSLVIEDKCAATAHPGGEIAARGAEHNNCTVS